MDTSKITNVLIFKDGYYYLTIKSNDPYEHYELGEGSDDWELDRIGAEAYYIVPNDWGINNGFEFASDAYAYLRDLKEGVTK